jgi:signal transduction histidine kinase
MNVPIDCPPVVQESRWRSFAVRGVRAAMFGVVLAFVSSGFLNNPFWTNLVQSVSISICTWFAIDLMRIPLAWFKHRNAPPQDSARDWPGWPLMSIAIVLGTFIGFGGGAQIAALILGHDTIGFLRGSWRQTAAVILGSLVPGVGITYWFYSRETMAAQEAAVQLAQRQAAEHQLKLLESQLEPHMLFNTLANLRVLIGMDPPRAQAMLDQLIGFLRATLSASRTSQHPLKAEFARIADYFALMQIRMGDRLQTTFDLPDALADVSVPPLLLQPLVENSIKHGLEPSVAGGRIDVSATSDKGDLVLRVRDTGAGLSESQPGGTKFGLQQVRERLATLYGTRASLTLSNAEGAEGGTLAIVRLPIVRVSIAPSTAAATAVAF